MASLALDPIIVAKINALLASSFTKDSGSGFATEDIVEIFETFLCEKDKCQRSSIEATPHRPIERR
jgi:hypothetical protein